MINNSELAALKYKIKAVAAALLEDEQICSLLTPFLGPSPAGKISLFDNNVIEKAFQANNQRKMTDVTLNAAFSLNSVGYLLFKQCPTKAEAINLSQQKAIELLKLAIDSNAFQGRYHNKLKFFNHHTCLEKIVNLKNAIEHANQRVLCKENQKLAFYSA